MKKSQNMFIFAQQKWFSRTICTHFSQQNDFPYHFYTSFSAKWFSPPFLQSLLLAGKRYSKAKHLFCLEEECHEYDMTAAPYF
jgi:hypothetical protein